MGFYRDGEWVGLTNTKAITLRATFGKDDLEDVGKVLESEGWEVSEVYDTVESWCMDVVRPEDVL